MKIRVTKEFDFEAAHALDGYDGKCKDIHGHSYRLQVTVLGSPIQDENHVKRGMVIDFGDLKLLVKKEIIDRFDHALILEETSRFSGIEKQDQKVVYVPYQPTCECMLLDFVARIQRYLPAGIELRRVVLRETGNSFAEWQAIDNI